MIDFRRMVRPSGTGHREHAKCGQADLFDELRARVSSWPPLRPARLRRERGSVGVASPAGSRLFEEEPMRRVIGMDIHRTFAEVVVWEDGQLRHHGRVDMTRPGLEGFGRSLRRTDEIVVEATGYAMAVVRVLSPYVGRIIVTNPMQVKAIAHARIKTDKIREIGRLAEDLADLDREIAREAVDDVQVRRLQTITGVNAIVESGIIAAVGDIRRFREPQKLVSYFGLNPLAWRNMAGSANMGVPMPAPCWSRPPGRRRRRPDRSGLSSCASATSAAIRSQPWRSPASSPC